MQIILLNVSSQATDDLTNCSKPMRLVGENMRATVPE